MKVFPAKIDPWLGALLVLSAGLVAVASASLVAAPVAEITRITPTRNPLSSPALSLDRLRNEYGRPPPGMAP